jgi:hypothetical protein
MIRILIVRLETTLANPRLQTRRTAIWTGRTQPSMINFPIVPIGAGQTIGCVGTGGATGMTLVT